MSKQHHGKRDTMSKEWKYIEWEQCPCCGNSLEGLTNCGQVEGVQHFYDGDVVRCVSHSLSTDCEASNLQIVAEEDSHAWVNGDW